MHTFETTILHPKLEKYYAALSVYHVHSELFPWLEWKDFSALIAIDYIE